MMSADDAWKNYGAVCNRVKADVPAGWNRRARQAAVDNHPDMIAARATYRAAEAAARANRPVPGADAGDDVFDGFLSHSKAD